MGVSGTWVTPVLLAIFTACTAAAADDPPPRRCNGQAQLCDRTLDQVALAGAHNAMSNAAAGWLLPNHNFGLARQLDDGIRAFLLDTHSFDDPAMPDVAAWLCHGKCELGRLPLRDGLAIFVQFMTAHPNEVIVLLFEDGVPPMEVASLFEETGLQAFVYTGEPEHGWPTLGALIDGGGRLIVTAESEGPPPAWHHRFWDLGWDTPYGFNSLAQLAADRGAEDSCRHNRGTTKGSLFLLNHWVANGLGLPDSQGAVTANSHDFLLARAQRCAAQWDHMTNIVAVDFHDVGDVIGVVDVLNGVAGAP